MICETLELVLQPEICRPRKGSHCRDGINTPWH